jgi:3-oxoacyl-[acyl-carrier protein] reductase
MDLGIANRTAIVTGGSRGLGRQIALSLAQEGCNIAICARDGQRLSETAKEIEALGVKVTTVEVDITDASAAEMIVSAAQAIGPVEIMVNNVGGGSRGGPTLEKTTDEELLEALQLNLLAATRLIKLVTPSMRESQWGRIVSVASIWGREYGGTIGYMTAKAALIAMSKHLALELAADNILVNTIAPGSIKFPGGSWERFESSQPAEVVSRFIETNLPMGKFGWPEPVGDLVTYLCSDRAGMITGTSINIDGGQGRSLL